MLVILLLIIIFLLYHLFKFKNTCSYFDSHGIRYVRGYPIFGNILKSAFLKRHYWEDIDVVYKTFPRERYVGYAEGTKRVLLIRDPQLMKLITLKDADHFLNRKDLFPVEVAPLLGDSLIMMKGDEWKTMRHRLSPVFTGIKMRGMLPLIGDICNNYINYLKARTSQELNVDDLFYRYTSDVIASAAFGLQTNSVVERDNKFFVAGQKTVNLDPWKRLIYFMAVQSKFMGGILQFLGLSIIPKDVTDFFRSIITDTINHRRKYNVSRPDYINIFMEISKDWTTDEICGTAFFTFIAGYESSSSTLTLCIHELALNPHIQEKLYQEIRNDQEFNEDLTYERINTLKYLDCVLSETSRKWSAAIMMDRICTKPYVLPPPREGGQPYVIRPGDLVFNVVNSIHMDPKYHPDPENFNPDRFLDNNKHNIKEFTYMPFGMGPRNCLGMRFALLQMKLILYNLILNFKILKCKKTQDPIQIQPHEFNIRTTTGTWVNLEKRI